MKFQRSPFGVSSIEPLEARIAPATIKAGAPNTIGSDTDYNESPFVNLASAPAGDLIASSLGPVAGNAYYLKLNAGDELQLFSSNSYREFLVVTSGTVVAFFVDLDGDNEVSANELQSLSLSKNAAFSLASGLPGDIVANLKADGSLDMSGLVSDSQSIKSITIGNGDVVGKIMAGGDINRVFANGRVGGILAGSAADGEGFDFFPTLAGGDGTVSFTPTAGVKGGAIKNIFVDAIGFASGEGRIEAGAGGTGAAGGFLKNIQITEDFDGFSLKAGDGGSVLGKAKGGAGGGITGVYISGVLDSTLNDQISIFAGNGGDSVTGTGGNGGALSQIFVGYSLVGKKAFASGNNLFDNVEMESGTGGDGRVGGSGGNISSINVLVSAPDMAGVDEISVKAGKGGGNVDPTGGKAGKGGSVSKAILSDLSLDVGPSILVQAGDGGGTAALGKGGAGGSVSSSTLLASTVSVLAGNGSAGTVGGVGGSLTKLLLDQSEGVIPHVGLFNAGFGGDGSAGKGGNGGNVVSLRVTEGDFSQFDVNSGSAANGGNSVGGKGGKGGNIQGLELSDSDLDNGLYIGTTSLRTGNGGFGSKGGGNGGSVISSSVVSEDLDLVVRTGAGGNAEGSNANGRGGAGGIIQKSQFVALGQSNVDVPASATFMTGAGGNGIGKTGVGGAGGDFVSVLMRIEGSISALAGNGGNGADSSGVGNAAGKGGSFRTTGAFATAGDGSMIAGNGGTEGVKPGAGGSIVGNGSRLSGLFAAGALTLQAGNGTNGGAGGSISNVGYGSSERDLTPTPSGNILVKAGDGSAEGKFAGAGGSIKSLTGSVSSSSGTQTLIYAGVGGGGTEKSAAGGSIVDIRIERGGSLIDDGPLTELKILAGDAGNGGSGVAKGAKGGDVSNVRIFNLSDSLAGTDTLIRSIAAGRGGDAGSVGGKGGTIDKVRTLDHDIGVRYGETYGYDTMGGIFAGVGGSASVVGKSGDVTNVTARAISAIVAGRGAMPALVEKVENIYLFKTSVTGQRAVDLLELEPDPLNPLESDLDFTEGGAQDTGNPNFYAFNPLAYSTNNFVGAAMNPFDVDGNMFHFNDTNGNGEWDFADGETPIDGLIAAKIFNQAKVNFTPEARLIGATIDDAVFYDYDNRNA